MKNLEMDPSAFKNLAKFLCNVDFLASLPFIDINRILTYVQLHEYKSREIIFKQGQPADTFFIIYEGEVEVRAKKYFFFLSKRMAILRSGDFFGETALIDRSSRTATVKTLTPTKLFVFAGHDFDFVTRNNPAFAEIVKKASSQRKFDTQSALS